MSKRNPINGVELVLCIVGVCYAAIAITGLIAVGLVLASDHEWRGDFLGLSLKYACWAVVTLNLAWLSYENRRLKTVLLRLGGQR